MVSLASQKRRPFTADFRRVTDKNLLGTGQKSVGDAPMLSRCSLLINPSPKPTGVLEHCCEGENIC
jgi:hypothetical protein